MSYAVEYNRHTGTKRLVFRATQRRKVIGKKGAFNRRLLKMNGRVYHVTKGYRVREAV